MPGMHDPHGIYGTRTAQRVRSARRRRVTQNSLIGCAFAALVLALVIYKRLPHTTTIASDWQTHLMTDLVALPAWSSDKDGGTLLVPTESGNLVAVDAQHGTARQSFATAFPLRAQPLVVKDVAYVPCQDGTLYAVSWRAGQVLWSHATGVAMTTRPAYTQASWPSATPQPATLGTPQASGAPAAVSSLAGATPPRPGAVSAPTIAPSPAPSAGLVLAGNDEGNLMALRASNGAVVWQRTASGPIGCGLTTTRDATGRALVLVPLLGGVAARGGLWCLDARTGVPVWKFPQDNKAFAAQLPAPAVDGNGTEVASRVYCADDSGAVLCLDLKTGHKIWKTYAQPLPATQNAVVLLRGQPMLKRYAWGERLTVGGNDGGVRSYDARDGHLAWTFNAGAAVRCRPQAARLDGASGARDILLVGCDAPAIYALEAQSGALLWKFQTTHPAYAGAVLLGQHVLTVTSNGDAQSFSLPR